MYADDNNGTLPPNEASGEVSLAGSWIQGDAKTDRDTINIEKGVLFPYNTSVQIYRCPADKSRVTRFPNLPRTRSISMSTGVAHLNQSLIPKPIYKFEQIVNPGPSRASIFIDEDEWSIQNGALGIEPIRPGGGGNDYWNLPTSRHSRGGTFSFADGHAEVWKWVDRRITEASDLIRTRYLASPGNYDVRVPSTANDRDLRRIRETVPPLSQ
jgi:prepilin-type processing-associated H-X9-DG protein